MEKLILIIIGIILGLILTLLCVGRPSPKLQRRYCKSCRGFTLHAVDKWHEGIIYSCISCHNKFIELDDYKIGGSE